MNTSNHGFVLNINNYLFVCVSVEEMIGNDFKEDKEIDEPDDVCAKAHDITKNEVKKKLAEIYEKSTENRNKIIDVNAQLTEMTSGNANCGDNDLLFDVWWTRDLGSLVGRITFMLKAQRLKNSYHGNANGKGDSGSGRGEVAEVTRTPGSALGQLHRAQYTETDLIYKKFGHLKESFITQPNFIDTFSIINYFT